MLKTVGRAIQLLAILGVHPDGMTLSELARELRSNKQAVFRLVKTLSAFHFVTNNPHTGKLRLGSGLLRMADAIRPELDLRQVALSALTELRDQTGETACLHVMFGADERMCIVQVESRDESRWVAEVGKAFPITVGAPGKIFFAFMPQRNRERLTKETRLVRLTSESIVDRKQLERAIDKVRRDRYAIARNETVPGMASVSAPVFDAAGRLIAAVTLLGSSQRLTDDRLRAHAAAVCEAAHQVSALLGHDADRRPASAARVSGNDDAVKARRRRSRPGANSRRQMPQVR